MKESQWAKIAKNYEIERDSVSPAHFLLDDLVVSRAVVRKNIKILDYGAGSGTISRLMCVMGGLVRAYEPMKEMHELLLKNSNPKKFVGLKILDSHSDIMKAGKFDAAVCINVLNHIKDAPAIIKLMSKVLKKGGKLIISIPHPIKNLGAWKVKRINGGLVFDFYRLNNYMEEGRSLKPRVDINGRLVAASVVINHRRISTYLRWLLESGFVISDFIEPMPAKKDAKRFPLFYSKSSKIPYFLVLECVKK